jgi:hypothetical protein
LGSAFCCVASLNVFQITVDLKKPSDDKVNIVFFIEFGCCCSCSYVAAVVVIIIVIIVCTVVIINI